MSLVTFIKLVKKAVRYATVRPLQRFNVANRSKKYLGPDAKHFKPAPRAIGVMSRLEGKPPQYPHIAEGGFISVRQRRLQAMQRDTLLPTQSDGGLSVPIRKSFSVSEDDDSLIRDNSDRLRVLKTVARIATPGKLLDKPPVQPIANSSSNPEPEDQNSSLPAKPSRSLPKLTSLQLDNPLFIWVVDKVPPGRISLSSLQELTLNKMADSEYWTPERLAEKYNVKPEYAGLLTDYVSSMKLLVPPRIKYLLDYIGHADPVYQATKDIVYEVDISLRNESDKRYDAMFLPEEEELDDRVKQVLGPIKRPEIEESDFVKVISDETGSAEKKLLRKPEPLRISPMNVSKPDSRLVNVSDSMKGRESTKRLESAKKV